MAATQVPLFCTRSDVEELLSASGVLARIDDDEVGRADDSPNWLRAANVATARVRAYCEPRYAKEDLAGSYLVNEWATIIAAHWLCSRRGNPVPDSIKEWMFGDGTEANPGVMGELASVRRGVLKVPGLPTRFNEAPAWSNVRVDPAYRLRQLRVQRPISERTPTQYPQGVDWKSEFTFEI